jgi:transcriptional regulator with XRE-family HTH domain
MTKDVGKMKENIFGKRLASLRKAKGLTQKELADKINIAWHVLSDYERGKARLNDKIIYQLSIALHVSSDEILGLDKKTTHQDQSLKIMRRLNRITKLNPLKQKKILSTIDDLIFAAEKK